MSYSDDPQRPAWAAIDLEEKDARETSTASGSGSEQGDYMDRDELEKDLRFRLEDRLEEGEEDSGFLGGGKRPPSKRRRPRALVLALLGILTIASSLGLLGASTFSAPGFSKQGGQKHITMDHVFNGTFSARAQRIDWVKEAGDGVFSTQNSQGDIFLEDASNNATKRLLVNASQVLDVNGEKLRPSGWRLSADMQYILFKADYRKQWRHSSFGNYYVHRLSDHLTVPLDEVVHPATISYAEWSPVSHSLAFVKANDIFVVNARELDRIAEDQPPRTTQVTFDGSETRLNGVPDWVYEEEVFSTNFAMWWSPQADRIAFLKSDEATVEEYKLQYYNPSGDAFQLSQYPKEVALRYPKPGTPNPLVSVHVYDMNEQIIKTLEWQGQFPLEDRLITEVAWVGPTSFDWIGRTSLLVKEVDRAARHGQVVIFEEGDSRGTVTRRLGNGGEEGEKGWIDHGQNVRALPGHESAYLDVLPTPEGYSHIAMFQPITSSEPIWLTQGEWEVADGVTGLDVEQNLVYFLAAKPSTERRLHSARIPASGDAEATPELVAMTDSAEPAYYAASFSTGGGFYVLSYQGPGIPWQKLVQTSEPDNALILEDNRALNETALTFRSPIISYTTVMSDGVELNAVELLPPNFDASGRKKYPVLFRVYGGPGSQMVSQRFERDWHHYLAAEKKVIVVTVDGRGTGYKGRAFRDPITDNLGYYEVIDQVNAAKEWGRRRYVDNKRIGIWGWSYGGFMAAKTIEADSGIFSLGMAVAPVTSWLFYDSIYTERYMNTPQKNPQGYQSSAVNNVTAFSHANFLLAHGSGDDNVNFQNSAALLQKFTQERIRGWRFRMFTDSDHSMSGRGAYRELFELLNDFIQEKWLSKTHTGTSY